VAWSPDRKQIASGSRDDTIKIWDSQSGDCQSTLSVESQWPVEMSQILVVLSSLPLATSLPSGEKATELIL